jgi:hypothetical protein
VEGSRCLPARAAVHRVCMLVLAGFRAGCATTPPRPQQHRLALLPIGTRHGIGVALDEVLVRESIQPFAQCSVSIFRHPRRPS